MATKLVNIKFHDKDADTTSFGTCPEAALPHWLSKGFEQATDEEVAAARGRVAAVAAAPSVDDLANGLVLDVAPDGEPVVVIDPADPVVAVEPVPPSPADLAPKTSDAPPAVQDPTAGDDAESKADDKPARGGRRPS